MGLGDRFLDPLIIYNYGMKMKNKVLGVHSK